MGFGGAGKSDVRSSYGVDGGVADGSAYSWGKAGGGGGDPYAAGGGGGDPYAGGDGSGWGKGGKSKGKTLVFDPSGYFQGMAPGGGGFDWSGKGKGGKAVKAKPAYVDPNDPEFKYPGLRKAVTEASKPVAENDEKLSVDDYVNYFVNFIGKAADQFAKDKRQGERGSPIAAHAVVEEFVETAMLAISQKFHDKVWVMQVNFADAICLVAETIFKGGKLFSRMLAPMLHKYVEDAIFRFRESERIFNAIQETVQNSGLPDAYWKKCCKHLNTSYDDAHISASYGGSMAAAPELGLLQDFMKGWMAEFCGRAWDVLENGVGATEEQVNFTTNLFQTLSHPERSCLPHDLVASLDQHPPASWPFIAETTIAIFTELNQPSKKQQRGGKW